MSGQLQCVPTLPACTLPTPALFLTQPVHMKQTQSMPSPLVRLPGGAGRKGAWLGRSHHTRSSKCSGLWNRCWELGERRQAHVIPRGGRRESAARPSHPSGNKASASGLHRTRKRETPKWGMSGQGRDCPHASSPKSGNQTQARQQQEAGKADCGRSPRGCSPAGEGREDGVSGWGREQVAREESHPWLKDVWETGAVPL